MSAGDDGSETPSAPESRDAQAPQEPVEGAGDDGAAERGRLRLLPVWILLGAAVISGGAWAVTERMGAGPPPDEGGEVRLVAAPTGAWKVRPDDPGGMEIPNQDKLIYETLTTADPEEAPERILPPPEEPLKPPQPPEPPQVAEPSQPTQVAEAEAERPMTDPGEQGHDAAPQAGTAPVTVEVATLPTPAASDPASVEDAGPPAPEASDAAPAEKAALPEPAVPLFTPDGIPLPPPKPGTLLPAALGEAPPPESDATAFVMTEPTVQLEPAPEAEQPAADEDASPREETAGVPLPVAKPQHLARAEPAAEPPEETAAALDEPVPAAGRIWRYVQLGAADSRRPLEVHWEMLRRRHDDALVGLSPLIMPVDRDDGGITYRLRAGPLSDEAAARRVCALLEARGLDCFVPRD